MVRLAKKFAKSHSKRFLKTNGEKMVYQERCLWVETVISDEVGVEGKIYLILWEMLMHCQVALP